MRTKRLENWHGMGWIRKEKRLAIYLRDGLACVYCGKGVEEGITLTLDHLDLADGNVAENLVTACSECNCHRARMDWKAFAGDRVPHILALIAEPLESESAKLMLERCNWKESLSYLAQIRPRR